MKPRPGKQIGAWKLVERLGAGGNANVWKAVKDDGSAAAIKILKPGGQTRYKRFKSEVELLLNLGLHPGVLPLVDASLPDSIDNENVAWLAMPVATGIVEALGDNPPLELVVESIASVAETLASLSAKGIFHRDIKPSNLYQHEQAWKVGDFGLADYPSKEALTVQGRKLGPLYFMPDEMITNADTADGEAADVYCLSKTLWVLGSGQNFPPQGQLRLDMPQLRLSNNIGHPRARVLDLFIDRATHPDPKQRPRMDEVAKELRAWLQPISDNVSPRDISDLGSQIKAAVTPVHRADERKRLMLIEVGRIPEMIRTKLRPLRDEMGKYDQFAQLSRAPDILKVAPASPSFGSPDVWWEETCCVTIGTPDVTSSSGFGFRLTDDGNLTIIAAHVLRRYKLEVIWRDFRVAPLGSALQENAIDKLFQALNDNLRTAVQRFVNSFNT